MFSSHKIHSRYIMFHGQCDSRLMAICMSLLQVATMSFLVLLNSALVNSNRTSSV